MPRRGLCLLIAVIAPLPALLAIPFTAALSPWWRLWSNAISDLGNPFKAGPGIAAVIDSAYALTGVLIAITSYCASWISKAERAILFLIGYTLNVVGVVNESYGILHFEASVAFFLTLAACIVAYVACSVKTGRRLPALYLAPLCGCIALWYLHFTERIPPGAAIPELASVALFLSYYYPRTTRASLIKNRAER